MYKMNARIRYSEVDCDGKLTIDGVLNYFQDCSIFNAEDLGVGTGFQSKRNIAWILLTWQIEVNRYPVLGEEIVLGTFPYAFKASFGYRNFVMETTYGETLARADSLWLLVNSDLVSRADIPSDMLDVYELEKKLPMEYNHKKIVLPENSECMEPFTIAQHHLDTNHHVNNGQYIRIMSSYLPKNKRIIGLKAEYRDQAKLGDSIITKVGITETDITVALLSSFDTPYAVGRFTIAD